MVFFHEIAIGTSRDKAVTTTPVVTCFTPLFLFFFFFNLTDIWFYCAKDITDGGSCQHLQCTGAQSAEAAPTP